MDEDSARKIISDLITLYEMQEIDEQMAMMTTHQNGVGFNMIDASFMTSVSKQIIEKQFVTEKQLASAQPILRKYTLQLTSLAPSTNPAIAQTRIYTPAQKPQRPNGILSIENGKLIFIPNVYPSVQIKETGKWTWRGKGLGWEGNLNLPVIEAVDRKFSPIQLDQTVVDWIEEQNRPVELSTTVTESSLFPGQKRGTASLLKAKRAMLGFKPGLGKTAAAVFAVNELDPKKYDSVLVVCPLTLCRNWQAQIKKWLGVDSTVWHGKVDTWENYDRFVITNYETVARNLKDIQNQDFTILILDETIMLKNRKAKRADACKELAKGFEYLWLLTGSPISKFVDDIWSQLNIIDPKRFSSYWRFVEQYCTKETNQWGTMVVGNQDDGMERLLRDTRDIYFTADESEWPVIPDWVFDTVEVPMSDKQYKLYKEMEDTFLATIPDGDDIIAANVLSQMVRLQQFSSNPLLLDGPNEGTKWDAVLETLDWEQGPFIVWTQFIRTAELMTQRCLDKKLRVETLTGATPALKRQEVVDKMQNGELDVIVAHPGVGKFGLTLTAVRTTFYLERSFNGDDFYQSLYRNKRIGTEYPPHVYLMVSTRPNSDTATIDGVVDQVLQFRKDSSIKLTTGVLRTLLTHTPAEIEQRASISSSLTHTLSSLGL